MALQLINLISYVGNFRRGVIFKLTLKTGLLNLKINELTFQRCYIVTGASRRLRRINLTVFVLKSIESQRSFVKSLASPLDFSLSESLLGGTDILINPVHENLSLLQQQAVETV